LVLVNLTALATTGEASAQGTRRIADRVHEVTHVGLEAGSLHGTIHGLRSQ
jgi:hypothetical protein